MAKKKSTRRRATFNPKDAEGKHLVIVESPTKAKTINKYLGSDYCVMSSVGHIRDLPKSAPKGSKRGDHPVPGVDLDKGFEPTYEIMPDKKSTVTDLKKAAKLASDVWFATDLDREGEAIAWHLTEALGVPVGEAKRVVFNAITKDEIKRAFDKPRKIATNRVDAQQARRILDRIVGYQVSPLLWKKVAGGLSAGRVQSVAVRVVVEREREIEAFIPDEFWKISGIFATEPDRADGIAGAWKKWLAEDEDGRTIKDQNRWLSEAKCLKSELFEFEGKKFQPTERDSALKAALKLGFDLKDTQEVEDPKGKGPAKHLVTYVGNIAGNAPAYTITDVQTSRTSSRPSAPFITSTMQQAASNRLGFPLQRCMRVAQQLYEGIDLKGTRGQTGLITYMRTDSTHISKEALEAVRSHIKGFGDEYLPDKPNVYKSSNKDAQEAHEAIRPADVTITPESIKGFLSEEQLKLYKLIWQRFVASQMMPAKWDATSVIIEPKGVNAKFRASGRTLVFDGFLKVAGIPLSDQIVLPPLKSDQPVSPITIDPAQTFTSPPPRYNEASLQKKLEEEGIGRPSTYASIIQTIQSREYVEPYLPRDRRLRATDLGKVVTDKLVEAFPTIMDVGYTREMEAHLDEIESDNKDWRVTLQEFYGPFKIALAAAHENTTHAKAEVELAPDHLKCPKCGSPTAYRLGRNGRFLGCTAFDVPPEDVKPEGHPGTWQLHKAKGKARPKIIDPNTGDKVGWTKLTKEDKVKFQAMSEKMPESCAYAAPIDREGNPMEPEMTDILCPEDGSRMIKRTGRFGPFLSSVNYPDVKYIVKLDAKKATVVLPKTAPMLSGITCSKCEEHELFVRDSKRGLWLSCSSFPKCRGRVGFTSLEEKEQKDLEKRWTAWKEENPVPILTTIDGEIIPEGYEPKILSGGAITDEERKAGAA